MFDDFGCFKRHHPRFFYFLSSCGVVGVVFNQVEMHPLLPQDELRDYCERHDIQLVAYSPLMHGDVFDVPELNVIADDRGVSEAQGCLAWPQEKGVCAVPKASGEAHLEDNLDSASLALSDDDIGRIDAIDRKRRISAADWTPW